MTQLSPQEVLRTVAADLKIQGLTHAVAAKRLGMKSAQSLSNLLSSQKYMSRFQAERFQRAFNYNIEYLMSGSGKLSPYYETTESPQQYIFHDDTRSFYVIDDTREGDLEQIIYWFGEFFSMRDNQEGLAFLAVVNRFFQARKIAEQKMRGYTGTASYKEAYDELLNSLRASTLSEIEDIIRRAKNSSE